MRILSLLLARLLIASVITQSDAAAPAFPGGRRLYKAHLLAHELPVHRDLASRRTQDSSLDQNVTLSEVISETCDLLNDGFMSQGIPCDCSSDGINTLTVECSQVCSDRGCSTSSETVTWGADFVPETAIYCEDPDSFNSKSFCEQYWFSTTGYPCQCNIVVDGETCNSCNICADNVNVAYNCVNTVFTPPQVTCSDQYFAGGDLFQRVVGVSSASTSDEGQCQPKSSAAYGKKVNTMMVAAGAFLASLLV